jgi:hypothetical protein
MTLPITTISRMSICLMSCFSKVILSVVFKMSLYYCIYTKSLSVICVMCYFKNECLIGYYDCHVFKMLCMCHYSRCYYSRCRWGYVFIFKNLRKMSLCCLLYSNVTLNVIMLSVVLSFWKKIVLSVIMPNVMILKWYA